MAHGGHRPGSGRKEGAASAKTRAIADGAAEGGITPLEYMLTLLRDEGLPQDVRFEAAKAAAQYMHPRLSSTDSTVKADLSGGFTWQPQQ